MNITGITQENLHAFQAILPLAQKYQSTCMFGCVMDDTAVGTVVIRGAEEDYAITWLWVAPQFRGQGIGSALLDKVCEMTKKESRHSLILTYPSDEPWTAVLEYMLIARGFTVLVHTYPGFYFTGKQLLEAEFMKKFEEIANPGILPLGKVSHLVLRQLILEGRQRSAYPITTTDLERADGERSLALVRDGQIHGLTLVSTFGAEDMLSLDLLYLKKAGINEALALLKQTAIAALRHPAGLRGFHFICTEEAGTKICSRLMGPQEAVMVEYCHGVLDPYLYREGGGYVESNQ